MPGVVAVEIGLLPGDEHDDGVSCLVCGGTIWVLGRLPRTDPPVYRLGCKEAWNPERRCPVQREVPEGIVIVEEVHGTDRG